MLADTWTHSDVIEFLEDRFETASQDSRIDRMRSVAVRTVYRDMPNKHRWAYFNRRGTLVTAAPYSTGTIEYDHTGGSSERMVTLTTGTWPTWARYGTLKIGDVSYKVASRVSGTVITLDSENNPGEDVASGTSYSLFRSSYPLPNGFRKIAGVFDVANRNELEYVSPAELLALSVGDITTGTPRCWTLRGLSADYHGQVAIEFWPSPSEARTITYLLGNQPRELLLPANVIAGTVSVTGGATTVTGVSTAFPDACVGSVIRFSSDGTSVPTGLHGTNPYAHQTLITARASTTSLTIADAPSSTLSAVKYTISDPIDIDPGPMLTCFLKACIYEFASLLMVDQKVLAVLATEKIDSLRMAMDADYRPDSIAMNNQPYWGGWSLADWGQIE